LKDICNAIEKMPLTKRITLKVNLYCNVGAGQVQIKGTPVTSTTLTAHLKDLKYDFNDVANSFSNTNPVMVNYMFKTPYFPSEAIEITTTYNLNYSLFIGKPQDINIGGISCKFLTSGGAPSQNLQSCRCYFYQFTLKAEFSELYMEKHVEKKIIYQSYLVNQDNNIPAGSSYQKLITPGVRNPVGIMIIPLISKSFIGFSQYQSPFDSCPSTTNPLGLLNVNVLLGSRNILENVIDYNYDEFLSQISTVQSVMSGSWGVSNGLISQKYWEEAMRVYYVNLSRCQPSDRNILRSLEVKFINNNSVPIDLIYITLYDKECMLNTQTGMWSST
jgi:hypothetical protein